MNVFEHESTCDSNFGDKKLVTIFVCYRTSETKFVDDKLEILMTDSVFCLIRALYFFKFVPVSNIAIPRSCIPRI